MSIRAVDDAQKYWSADACNVIVGSVFSLGQ